MRRVLVAGGAGYIGSHMVKALRAAGIEPVVLDSLRSGHRDAVREAELIEGDLGDRALLDEVLSGRSFDAVMHFASFIQVGESVRRPDLYYRNNVTNTQTLLEAMREHEVGVCVFSSSAAIFGEPEEVPIAEEQPKAPINPYGRSKWMVEQMLEDWDRAFGLRSASLRYFNAAGADPDGELGERHDPETHLIPLALRVAAGREGSLMVHGDDYDTRDGTCIRDYVHVADLCDAHLLALLRLWDGAPSGAYNLGNGAGFSVREVIEAARRVTGREIAVTYGPRRAGDPVRLVADSARARQALGWQPRRSALATIIGDAWRWEASGPPKPVRTDKKGKGRGK
ncbi:MAG TPA: UDP-glucose 4-epimerase GalE [Gammaproteobacteria bacterium]|nr:UDP-glucose 4-epimerase GalE [Gammaproteobacteria bacterium]